VKKIANKFHWTSLTYRGKLIVAIFFTGLIVALYNIYSEVNSTYKSITERELNRIDALGHLLADDITDDIVHHDSTNIRDILTLTAAQIHIRFLCVTDAKSKSVVQYSTNPALLGTIFQPSVSNNIFDNTADFFIRSFPLIRSQHANLPLMGYLHIGYSLKQARADIKLALFRSARNNGLMLLAALLMSWLFSGFLTAPLSEMREIAKKIATGNFSERIQVRSSDIIGDLASTLNMMASQLGDLTGNLQEKIREKTAELEETNKKLLELDKLKSDFVSMVSHELRTPLTSIIGFSRTLLNLSLPDEKRRECLKIIESEGKRLAAMVEETLDITKIEAGDFSLAISTFNLADLIRECTALLDGGPSPRVELSIPGTPLEIKGDKERVKRILVNLIDNGLKYGGSSGKVRVTAEVDGDAVVVGVHDHGPGISAESREKLFNRFYRGDDEIAAQTRGSGLGLYIVKNIVEAHNGKIWVDSAPGRGASFYFTIPKNFQAKSVVNE
jgi:signal transduction histidine kinase